MVFRNDDLKTVLQSLYRAYNVDIRLEGDVPGATFFGSFSIRRESIEDIVKQLDFHRYHAAVSRKSSNQLIVSVRP